jgi:uncharacterized ParB-like nuclease family protein
MSIHIGKRRTSPLTATPHGKPPISQQGQRNRWAGFVEASPGSAPTNGEGEPGEIANPLASSLDPFERELGKAYQAEMTSELEKITAAHTKEIAALGEKHATEIVTLEESIGQKYNARLASHQEEQAALQAHRREQDALITKRADSASKMAAALPSSH